ncbi:O-antigen ligase [Pseudoalteromonas sp. P1-25]|uniref:O-antigen ligase family protein n=1 Tax=Pseudoalteromonas sp. P1-25 TaxID=1723758 RepID=UPI0006D68BC0|nr:O-antigen ligase family protein [Pseudoalteromonas sp. P1-25]KPZ51893.1 O-Antigen ligase [Pseudoalteromonas sp. P1-25]
MKINNRSLVILFSFLLLSLLPSIDYYFLGMYNEKRGFQVATLVLSLIFIPKIKLDKRHYLFLVLVTLLALLSVTLSENKLQAILNFLHITMLVNIINLGFTLQKNIKKTILLLFFSNLFVVCYSLLNYSFFSLQQTQPYPDAILYGFYNIRFFNQFQIVCIPFIVYFIQHKELSRVASILLTLNIFLLLLSGARGAILASLVMFAFGSYYQLISKKQLLKILKCSFISLILFSIYFLHHKDPEVINYVVRTSSSLRVEIWGDLLSQLTLSNIFIGNGPGIYFSEEYGYSHPHNSVLQILYNWGGIITILVLILLFKLFKLSIRYTKSNNIPEFNMSFLSLQGLLTYSLVSGVIVMPIPQTFIFVLVGVLLSYLPLSLKLNSNYYKNITIYSSLCVVYMFFVVISYNCLDSDPYGPNFWSNGQISFSQCNITLFKDL